MAKIYRPQYTPFKPVDADNFKFAARYFAELDGSAGTLSADEALQARDFFASYNGYEDYANAFENVSIALLTGNPQVDRNGSGLLSVSENPNSELERLQFNDGTKKGAGTVDLNDFVPKPPPVNTNPRKLNFNPIDARRFGQLLNGADRNQDGQVTVKELMNAARPQNEATTNVFLTPAQRSKQQNERNALERLAYDLKYDAVSDGPQVDFDGNKAISYFDESQYDPDILPLIDRPYTEMDQIMDRSGGSRRFEVGDLTSFGRVVPFFGGPFEG